MNAAIQKYIKDGIISAQDLKTLIDSGASIKLIDASYSLPNGQDPYASYLTNHINDATFFDIDKIADQESPLPHMLPKPEDFGTAASALGLSNNDFIVVYGQTGIIMGPARVWWTFKIFGHDAVCVLDGGLPSWIEAGYAVSHDPVSIRPGHYKAAYRPALVKNLTQMAQASSESLQIYDARPAARFSGAAPEPRPGMRAGHIPGSRNSPATELVDPQGRLKAPSAIEAILQGVKFDPQQPVYATCGSGVTACVIALALYRIGYYDWAIYDGSWSEWGNLISNLPIATSI